MLSPVLRYAADEGLAIQGLSGVESFLGDRGAAAGGPERAGHLIPFGNIPFSPLMFVQFLA